MIHIINFYVKTKPESSRATSPTLLSCLYLQASWPKNCGLGLTITTCNGIIAIEVVNAVGTSVTPFLIQNDGKW